ncbi:hypothetical protein [Nocardia transvalensis]|uniref:hypothetical protein n=1 Tax=Nocardia transvalensis TaxID=37333 RepID=UPI00189396E9|nr:hypothetical protein [Nocardia transvalensis]MBF6330835.1 hypothetical protein [Nocardia transvalensis]
MNTPQNWRDWFKTISEGGSERAVGARMGRDANYVRRHVKIDEPPSDAVIAFAHAFEQNPVLALIWSGHVTPGEIIEAARSLDVRPAATTHLLDLIENTVQELKGRVGEPGPAQWDSTETSKPMDTNKIPSGTNKDAEREASSWRSRREKARKGLLG